MGGQPGHEQSLLLDVLPNVQLRYALDSNSALRAVYARGVAARPLPVSSLRDGRLYRQPCLCIRRQPGLRPSMPTTTTAL